MLQYRLLSVILEYICNIERLLVTRKEYKNEDKIIVMLDTLMKSESECIRQTVINAAGETQSRCEGKLNMNKDIEELLHAKGINIIRFVDIST